MKRMSKVVTAALVTLVATIVATPVATIAHAGEAYPQRPIRWVVPVPAGSTGDIVSRLVAQRLSDALQQQVIVDNRPGGVMVTGANIVAKAAPDGYTIGTFLTPYIINPFVLKNLPYDSAKDFTPISLMVVVPNVMTAWGGLPASTLKETIALAKAKPGGYSYGAPGVLTSGHLTMEMLKLAAGVDITYIPYKGGAPAIVDLISGQIHFLISGPPGVQAQIRAKRLKALAVTWSQRLPSLPETPTFAEAGMPGFETYGWYGVFGPANMPRDIVQKLSREVARLVKLPDFSEQFAAQGAIAMGTSPEELAAFVKRETGTWGAVAKKVKLQAE